MQNSAEVRSPSKVYGILADPLSLRRGVILVKVIEYLAYKVQWSECLAEEVNEDFSDRIDPYIALEL